MVETPPSPLLLHTKGALGLIKRVGRHKIIIGRTSKQTDPLTQDLELKAGYSKRHLTEPAHISNLSPTNHPAVGFFRIPLYAYVPL
jgi:hypothetical protein